MAVHILPPEYQKVVREIEIGRLQHQPSWRAVLPREVVPMAYTVEHLKTDKQVFATVSRRPDTRGGPKGILSQDRESTALFVIKSQMGIPWFDEMIVKRRPAGTLPTPYGSLDALNPQRLFREMLDEIERKADAIFYDGYNADGVAVDGFLDQAGTAVTIAGTLDTVAGRKDFVKQLAAQRKAARRKFAVGQPVLVMDASLTHFLDFPWEDTGNTGVSARSILQGTQPSNLPIVPVEAPEMQGKALLHFRDPTNAVYYESTPDGAETMIFGDEGEDKQLVMFRQLGVSYRRQTGADNYVFKAFDGL